ncbi:LysR substrate-binding domain-containing protein [Aliivibrio sp. S4TY2]|uniref:LysR substrate-binding domain-containing protein n=1 Tax=unclassified Aliivibrio TaxID=2645654 RepID=UPI002377F07B|nr:MULTISPECIES: LysR substrate-binding domain-containing protein [unclassified Aliivibrio]MDD9157154.1 LysR substrate-binding domain-containing protein [Aliivibrio sp. S4TY2]MDD9161013.1 LysR substrate-binding domain-containing protein [Aliivibrio sp. S4TY1]MDD9165066.1 LysR substrate-binding domain-containing protein [Aliivibrio sp. S4MY2]MDD9169041.1 LysR substrate-binding domain-containing protein [Aliivibrio sp. S4MY4]MDD9185769.1 LysR substrate-binding domain-containing protein [Aliivibr
MIDWEGVTEFVAVAEAQSFTGAARALDTSVAQISRKVAALEDRLSIKLLIRTTRKVSVTEAGQTYYQHCRHLVEGLKQADRAITELNATPQGRLKITSSVTYGEQLIAPLLSDFMLMYPQLELELILSNQTLDLVEQDFDLAIRLGRLTDSTMMAKRLSSRQVRVCASPGYIEKYGEPHTLSELSQHNCLVGSLPIWRFIENKKEKSVRVKGSVHCNSGAALTNAALKGLGIVQLPDFYVQESMDKGELVEILVPYREPKEGIWAVYPNNRHLSTKVRLLVEFLAKELAE